MARRNTDPNTYTATTQAGIEVTAHRITGNTHLAGRAWGYARTDPKPGVIRDIPSVWATIKRDGRLWVITPDASPYYDCTFHTLGAALACLGRWAVAEYAINARDRTYGQVGCL